ncbi:unnamed protein product [Acanthoscelides obtectus]|uniref:Ubiquitin thioesterase OTU n=1 Tax=Acanthoscelides obtectus TaxID=200917 RepID=A0A9P0M004_ACAOB|nr:unnamed protein product [Acanthoscelides obtectus]CAK1642405.1 Ubiquitin thioesterase OTU1 [Acanthoscelides obtectus]
MSRTIIVNKKSREGRFLYLRSKKSTNQFECERVDIMASIALRVKTKSGQQVVNTLNKQSTMKELKQLLSSISNIPLERLHVLSGFPPKTLDISQDNLSLDSSGITSGDTLILEEKAPQEQPPQAVPPPSTIEPSPPKTTTNVEATTEHADVENHSSGILMKQVVPADNSCLFTSINFVLNGKVDDSTNVAPYMRKLVAETINAERFLYDEAVLGKPVDDYCAWIQDDRSWGGAIELAILSNYYGIEIAVADTMNAIINRFGEDKDYPHRVFLMFDGIHYDPLYLEPADGSMIRTIFSTEDTGILKQAEQLAQEANTSRQYTDMEKFTLRCMVCQQGLKGQAEARQHAAATGHINFGEV